MAEQTYQDYKLSRLAQPAEPGPETPAETPEEATEPEEAETPDSPPDDDEEEEEPEGSQQPKQKRRNRTEQRFRRLNDRARRVERENDELRGQLQTLITLMQKGEPQPPADQPEGRPTRDQYPDEDDFIEAMADWKTEQKIQATLKQQEAKVHEQSQQSEAERLQQAHIERVKASKSRYTDWDEVVGDSDIQISSGVTRAIVESEQGPDIMYYLAQHPDEAERLNTLGPVALGRALAKIEAQSQRDESPTPPPDRPTPPTPIRPVAGGNAPQAPREPDKLSYRDYREGRLKGRIR